ncbi:MAG TPA: DUF6350 family protein [Microbacteriaceae bacterium]|nr:DUF6350 family protein [Microbacteriaceae bacterium]
MNRTTVALLAALEALIVVAIGIGIALVPLTVLWAAQYHLAIDWLVFWRAAADTWLVGHGVNLTVSLDPLTASSLGLPGAAVPFQVTIAALGFALLAILLGVRTGLRAALTPYRQAGVIAAVLTYGILATAITLSAGSALVRPSIWQGILLPTFVFGLGVVVGAGVGQARAADETTDSTARAIRAWVSGLAPALRSGAASALRAGTAAAALVLATAAVTLAVVVLLNFGTVIGLYEGLQAGALGGAALTVAQLAFLPDLVIWAASWLVGPGFAIGTGSSVSPVGTQLGPIPSLPLLGVLPPGNLALGFLGLLVPVLAGFIAAVVVHSRPPRTITGQTITGQTITARPSGGWLFLTALGTGAVAGIELGLLAWASSGAAGPGRLHDVGPDPWLIGGIAAAEVAVAAVVGMFASGRLRR